MAKCIADQRRSMVKRSQGMPIIGRFSFDIASANHIQAVARFSAACFSICLPGYRGCFSVSTHPQYFKIWSKLSNQEFVYQSCDGNPRWKYWFGDIVKSASFLTLLKLARVQDILSFCIVGYLDRTRQWLGVSSFPSFRNETTRKISWRSYD